MKFVHAVEEQAKAKWRNDFISFNAYPSSPNAPKLRVRYFIWPDQVRVEIREEVRREGLHSFEYTVYGKNYTPEEVENNREKIFDELKTALENEYNKITRKYGKPSYCVVDSKYILADLDCDKFVKSAVNTLDLL